MANHIYEENSRLQEERAEATREISQIVDFLVKLQTRFRDTEKTLLASERHAAEPVLQIDGGSRFDKKPRVVRRRLRRAPMKGRMTIDGIMPPLHCLTRLIDVAQPLRIAASGSAPPRHGATRWMDDQETRGMLSVPGHCNTL